MNKKILGLAIGMLIAVPAWPLFSAEAGGEGLEIISAEPQAYLGTLKLCVYEGLKEGASPAQNIASSYLKYTLTVNIPSDAAVEEERGQIRKTFNLKDVKLVTESNLKIQKGNPQEGRQMLRLDGKLYSVAVQSKNAPSRRFRVMVNEVSETSSGDISLASSSRPLLDTEFTIPPKNVAVFGFEDSSGKPYFISFREEAVEMATKAGVERGVEGGVESGVKGGVEGGVAGVAQDEEMGKKRQEFRKDAVPLQGVVKQPTLIKKVDPIYPAEARKNGVQGVVILEAKIDESGRVIDVMILRSVPQLNQAAVDALKQWVYEPMKIDGKPTKVFFTVTVRFQLDKEDIEKFAEGAVKIKDAIPPPKLTQKVDPVYPEAARKAGIEGIVILEARIDVKGRVKNVRVLRSVPALDQAAIDALRQWVYTPLLIDGQPKEAVFTVTVRFNLNGKGKEESAEKTSTGEVLVPTLIKKVDPVYPEAARKAGIQGTVLLEVTIDEKGNVSAVKVRQSIPELDQAAIDALKQWKYEPVIVEGKPKGVVFTVTIRFRLQ